MHTYTHTHTHTHTHTYTGAKHNMYCAFRVTTHTCVHTHETTHIHVDTVSTRFPAQLSLPHEALDFANGHSPLCLLNLIACFIPSWP